MAYVVALIFGRDMDGQPQNAPNLTNLATLYAGSSSQRKSMTIFYTKIISF